jgi:hypothetical protein
MAIKDTLKIAKDLGITLKNLKSFPGHDGMDGMDADICINGKKMLHVYDSANGGCFEYRPIDGDYKLDALHLMKKLRHTENMMQTWRSNIYDV